MNSNFFFFQFASMVDFFIHTVHKNRCSSILAYIYLEYVKQLLNVEFINYDLCTWDLGAAVYVILINLM